MVPYPVLPLRQFQYQKDIRILNLMVSAKIQTGDDTIGIMTLEDGEKAFGVRKISS